MNERIYKVHGEDADGSDAKWWVIRLPRWMGWLCDQYQRLRYGFVP